MIDDSLQTLPCIDTYEYIFLTNTRSHLNLRFAIYKRAHFLFILRTRMSQRIAISNLACKETQRSVDILHTSNNVSSSMAMSMSSAWKQKQKLPNDGWYRIYIYIYPQPILYIPTTDVFSSQ
eukprot:205788_1